MRKMFILAAGLLTFAGMIFAPLNVHAYSYTYGLKEPASVTISCNPDGAWKEDKGFVNNNRSFTVNSPLTEQKYTTGQEMTLSVTPHVFYYTYLPGGFSTSAANNLVMTILKDDTVKKTFRVNYSNDDLDKTFTDSFIPDEEGTYKINIYYRGSSYSGSNYGNYYVQVAKPPQKANPAVVKTAVKTVKYKKLKKKSLTVKAVTVKKAKGKVSFSKVSGSKKISVNSSTGKLRIKKGTRKGTYRIKVKIRAEGNSEYMAKTITKTVKIKVK